MKLLLKLQRKLFIGFVFLSIGSAQPFEHYQYVFRNRYCFNKSYYFDGSAGMEYQCGTTTMGIKMKKKMLLHRVCISAAAVVVVFSNVSVSVCFLWLRVSG